MQNLRLGVVFVFFISLLLPAAACAAALNTTAEHALLMDGDTGQVLWAKDAQTPVPPASMSNQPLTSWQCRRISTPTSVWQL